MAASDGLFVRVIGAGGHGSRPHDALDPMPAACEMVTALQTMVTRRFDVFEPVVLTVGVFQAGTKRNIIPDEASFRGDGAVVQPRRSESRSATYAIAAVREHRRRARPDRSTRATSRSIRSPSTTPPSTTSSPTPSREVFGRGAIRRRCRRR